MKSLSLDDFKNDYQQLVVKYESKTIRNGVALKLVERWYSHIQQECFDWLKTQ